MNQWRETPRFRNHVFLFLVLLPLGLTPFVHGANPYEEQAARKTVLLADQEAATRARAAEALGFLRYYAAEEALIVALEDASPKVRRNAALALGSCGGGAALEPLATLLNDPDWSVAQSAWVSLTNLTGMDMPFDALQEDAVRMSQSGGWLDWVRTLPLHDVRLLLESEKDIEVMAGLRALGALGAVTDTPLIVRAIAPWVDIDDEPDFNVKGRIQAGIRALGRLGGPEALEMLSILLHNRQWALYAAEALGDLGGDKAAKKLMDAFPRYAQDSRKTGSTPHTHPHDIPHLDPSDRILHVPYMIAYSLSRIPLDTPVLREHLRSLALPILTQIPLDYDGLMVYEEEPYQQLFRHLLEQTGFRRAFVDLAFGALETPRESRDVERLYQVLCAPEVEWHNALRRAFREPAKAEEEPRIHTSSVMRGQDAPLPIIVDVSGWKNLHLIVDDVDTHSMDRVNWAEARLIARDGTITYLDTLSPVSADQQHDVLRVNTSASFEGLRIAGQHFKRGLHTHAVSHIQYRLEGTYTAFHAIAGVCDSRSAGQGSVRFLVSDEAIHHRSQDKAVGLLFERIWEDVEDTTASAAARVQFAWERQDAAALWMPAPGDKETMVERYISAGSIGDPSFVLSLSDPAERLMRARERYYRSKLREELEHVLEHGTLAANILTALCREDAEVPALVRLLDHENHWVRINAAKTLAFMGATDAATEVADRFRASQPEADYGYFDETYFARGQGWDELSDPTPRYREALVMVLGLLQAREQVPLLVNALFEERNALEIQYRAANALNMIGTEEALNALQRAERHHPYHSVRVVAREGLWQHGIAPLAPPPPAEVAPPHVRVERIPEYAERFVFIKGDLVPYNPFQMDSWRQAYMTTDSGPTYRPGRNLFILDTTSGMPRVSPLTRFDDGYVADCEVSYDGTRVLFSRRKEGSPWWHVFEIKTDGTGLRQITDGPYHDVHPNYLPNGRIVFATTRLGMRDEYHGYLSTGLATMAPDGTDIQVIGFNFGRDAEPTVGLDGKILFTRLELFYSRMKTEYNLISAFPDGTRMQTLYGPERREFWAPIHGGYGNWTMAPMRHRVLRLVQPRAYRPERHLLNTPSGPILTRGRQGETLLREHFLREGGNDSWVIATPHPLSENTLLVAAGVKNHEFVADQFPKDAVDLGLYFMDVATGDLTLLYNDPDWADFEARPLHPRIVPPILVESPLARGSGYTGTLYADSVFITQIDAVREQGRLLRVIEGQPQVARHATHTTGNLEAWKNHGGAFARVLGTVPLAADGSFAVEVPADRLLHLQVLDRDRRVVGNQQVWMHVRPGERKGCIGCHEAPDTAAETFRRQLDAFRPHMPSTALPDGKAQLRYRAKVWFKGHLPDEREERQRTVQSTNWFGRN